MIRVKDSDGGKRDIRPSFVYTDGPTTLDRIQAMIAEDTRNVCEEIRDELRSLNRLLHCTQFQNIPGVLTRISRNTHKPRRRKRKVVTA